MTTAPGARPAGPPAALRYSAWALVGVLGALRIGGALARYLQVDELQLLHLAWLRVDGSVPGVDHEMPQFSLLIDLLEPIWRLVGAEFDGVWIARALCLAIGAGILLAVHRLAVRGFGPAAGLGAVLALSAMTDFNDRSFEVRSDGAMTACWVFALALLTPGQRRRPAIAGGLAALAIAFNFKAIVALPPLALAVAWPEVGEARSAALRGALRRAAWALGGFALAAAAYAGWLALRGDLALYGETVARNLEVARTAGEVRDPNDYWRQSLVRNAPFYALALGGAIVALRDRDRLGRWVPAAALAGLFALTNPTPFPYTFVEIAALLAPLCGAALAWLWRGRVVLATVALAALVGYPVVRGLELLAPSIEDQRAYDRFAREGLPPDARVYDASGLVLFRRGPRQWRLHSLMVPRYVRGAFRLRDELTRTPVGLLVRSYRLAWLTPADAAWLRRRFVPFGPIDLAGYALAPAEVAAGATAEILLAGRYAVLTTPGGQSRELEVDGAPWRGPRDLAAGSVRVAWRGAGPAPAVALVWWPSALQAALPALRPDLRPFRTFTE
jgi:hypothetical protein